MQEGAASIMLSVEEYAALRGCTARYIRRLCDKDMLEHQTVRARGGKNGAVYQIPLASLSDEEVKRYLRKKKKEEIVRGPNRPAPDPDQIINLNYEQLTEEEREVLNQKNKILDGWLIYRQEERMRGKSLEEADENYIRITQLQYPELKLSTRTIRRWDKLRREQGETALVDSRGKHTNHQQKMTEEVLKLSNITTWMRAGSQ